MRFAVIYASRTGNTRRVAEAVGEAFGRHGPVSLRSIDEAGGSGPVDADLLAIGAPTEGHGIYPPMIAYLDTLPAATLAGRLVAVFDTRLWWPRALSGSAATGIARRVAELGGEVIGSESFIVSMKPLLQPGELVRAGAWAEGMAARAAALRPDAEPAPIA